MLWFPTAQALDYEGLANAKSGTGSHHLLIKATGEVSAGDAERLERLFTDLESNYSFYGSDYIVSLNSTGGDYTEALKLLDTFRHWAATTYVDDGDECLSACAIAFLGGSSVNEGQVLNPDRVLHPKAKLGFHAPKLDYNDFGNLPENVLQASYAGALSAIAGLINRMEQAEIKRSLVEAILRTSPSEMRLISTVEDVLRWNIGVDLERNKDWRISTLELARVCMNASAWKQGKSSEYRWYSQDQAPPQPDSIIRSREEEQRLQTLVQRKQITEFNRTDNVYVIQTSDYEIEEHCVVRELVLEDNTLIDVVFTNASPDAAIEIMRTATMSPYVLTKLSTLPSDTELASLPNAGDRLDKLRARASFIDKSTGRCKVASGGFQTDNEPCIKVPDGDVTRYTWPSGAITVLQNKSTQKMINGSEAETTIETERTVCYRNKQTKNTFCYETDN